MRVYAECLLIDTVCAEPEEISMLWYLWYVASSGGCDRLWETENGAQVQQIIINSLLHTGNVQNIIIIFTLFRNKFEAKTRSSCCSEQGGKLAGMASCTDAKVGVIDHCHASVKQVSKKIIIFILEVFTHIPSHRGD